MKYVLLVMVVFIGILALGTWKQPKKKTSAKMHSRALLPDSLKKRVTILKVPGSPYPIPAIKPSRAQ